MDDPSHTERLAKLEQAWFDHLQHAEQAFQRNDSMHDKLWVKLDHIDARLDRYDRMTHYLFGAAFVVGCGIGWFIKEWDWFVNKLGH